MQPSLTNHLPLVEFSNNFARVTNFPTAMGLVLCTRLYIVNNLDYCPIRRYVHWVILYKTRCFSITQLHHILGTWSPFFVTAVSFSRSKKKKIWNRVDCQRSEKRSKTHKRFSQSRALFLPPAPTSNWHKISWTVCFSVVFVVVVRSLKRRTSSKMCTFCPVLSN